MSYVDGFVLPVPEGKLDAYRALAEKAGKVWKDHGALEYRECVLEDNKTEFGLPFPQIAGVKPGETVIFAYITYRSREHRDEVNAKVMADERMNDCGGDDMPFDCKRMAYGGFKTLVEA